MVVNFDNLNKAGFKPLRYNKLIICDLEATCWKGQPPPMEQSEIIEIGLAVVCLEKREIIQTGQIYLKPIRSVVSEYCRWLTGISQNLLDEKGITFKEACDLIVNEFDSKTTGWASQGNYDRTMFASQCTDFGVSYPWSKEHINIASLFAILTGRDRSCGMRKELDLLGLTLEGQHHSGLWDAVNTAKIFIEILNRGSFKV